MVEEHLLFFGWLVPHEEISLLLLLYCAQLVWLVRRTRSCFGSNSVSLLRHLWCMAFVFPTLLEVVNVHKLKEIELYILASSSKLWRFGYSKPFSFCLLRQLVDLFQSQTIIHAIIVPFAATHCCNGSSHGAIGATLSHLHAVSIDEGGQLLEMTTVLIAHQTLRLRLHAILRHLFGVRRLLSLV